MPLIPEIREIRSSADLKSIEQLQRDVWGAKDIDILAPLSLRASIETGALLLGAFEGARMVGFSYAFPALHDGRIEIHSDMTGVLPAYRDRGVGYRLKLAQRAWCLARGIRVMTWTFDPLRSRNAYFNFNKLGAISDSYRVDFYGSDSSSFLHQNSTDRLWITWRLDSPRVVDRLNGLRPPVLGEPFIGLSDAGTPLIHHRTPPGPQAVIEIPLDVDLLGEEAARNWRTTTRAAFLALLDAGFTVTNSMNGRYQLDQESL